MDVIATLQALGLGRYEAAVYVELLKLGSANAGPIVRATQLHRQFVYSALDVLEREGFVSHVVRSNRKVFQAAPPDLILKRQEEREVLARSILPQLRSLQPSGKDRLEVRVLYGSEEFARNLNTVLESAARTDGLVRIIGGARADEFYHAVGKRYDSYLERSKKLAVRKHMIAPASSSETFPRTICD